MKFGTEYGSHTAMLCDKFHKYSFAKTDKGGFVKLQFNAFPTNYLTNTDHLQWPHYSHNEHHGVSNHQHLDYLFKVCSGQDQRKHQSSASLAFVRGIHRWPVNSPHKGPVTRKMFPFHDFIILMVPWRNMAPRRHWVNWSSQSTRWLQTLLCNWMPGHLQLSKWCWPFSMF